jgi:hypothetical protein
LLAGTVQDLVARKASTVDETAPTPLAPQRSRQSHLTAAVWGVPDDEEVVIVVGQFDRSGSACGALAAHRE